MISLMKNPLRQIQSRTRRRWPQCVCPAQEVVPTEEWADFYGLGNTLNGQPLPVGVVIRAYDPQGVVCSQFRGTRAGCYGLMPV